ncbi:DUF433 domain-containing protein [Moorella sp. Hama-1]|uniref:DUF433 domain-containing protein n=1 Tax=Moorella sp. Hama-1 TaxID=2138101 RepID=UPI000D659D63|nr:hypothetical protein [Moorella sp. (in: firmicutes)]BCV20717.1 hypothetical protein hamaS1_07860 [Moorella sp. Hama-1]
MIPAKFWFYLKDNLKNNSFERIVINPKIVTGKPVIKGTRLTVQYILGLLAQGERIEDILKEYEGLTGDDIFACLLFAMEALESTTFIPLNVEVV